ncbi:MAG TPA: DUF4397 domain-containing protein [Gemmatimonadaceae bacterium]|nr:DUF4397 domain-containing protein [Gemmatimonadaceae bacterium]
MRIRYTLAAFVGLAVLTGCDKEVSGVDTVLQEAAVIRYVNAVPDTGLLDFRFVDGDIEGSPQYAGMAFRTFTPYQRVRAGTRQIKIFTNPNAYQNSAAVASQVHIDTTFTFEPNARYTIISFGNARSTAATRHRLLILRDELPATLTATQVGVRVIHAAVGAGNVDVYVRPSEVSPTTISGAPAAANVPERGVSAYLALAARPVNTTATGLSYRFDITAPGSTTSIPLTAFDGRGLLGRVGTAAANPLAGFQVGRTAVTVIMVPRSVAGSAAPQTAAFTTATALFLPDAALDKTEP